MSSPCGRKQQPRWRNWESLPNQLCGGPWPVTPRSKLRRRAETLLKALAPAASPEQFTAPAGRGGAGTTGLAGGGRVADCAGAWSDRGPADTGSNGGPGPPESQALRRAAAINVPGAGSRRRPERGAGSRQRPRAGSGVASAPPSGERGRVSAPSGERGRVSPERGAGSRRRPRAGRSPLGALTRPRSCSERLARGADATPLLTRSV